jgi:hypothetical protein
VSGPFDAQASIELAPVLDYQHQENEFHGNLSASNGISVTPPRKLTQ